MTAYSLHLRRSIFIFVAPVLAAVGSALGVSNLYPQVASHSNIANVFVATIAILAPVAAGFAAWDAIRERRHGGAPILDAAAQPPARVALVQLAAGATFALVIALLVLSALYVRGLSLTLADTPRLIICCTAVFVLLTAVSGGYAIGAATKHWAAVPLAAAPLAILYAVSLLAPGVSLGHSLIPFGSRAGGDFLDANLPFFAGQNAFLLGALLLVAGATAVASYRDRGKGITAICCATALIAGGAWMISGQNLRWGIPVEDNADRLMNVSSSDRSLTLEILPTYAPVSAALLESWQRTQELLALTPAAFSTLSQSSESHPEPAATVGRLQTIYLNPASSTIVRSSIEESLIDLHTVRCQEGGSFETVLVDLWLSGGEVPVGASLTQEDASRLAQLNALDSHAGSEWLAEHFEQYSNCTITGEVFPKQ